MKRKIDIIALIILIAAAMSCGLIGVFRFNVITWLFNGKTVAASRIIYTIVAAAGFWCINLIAVQAHRSHTKRYATSDSVNRINVAPDPVLQSDPINKRNVAPGPVLKSDPGSLKDNPDGETICHADFSDGCINEDTDLSTIIEEEGEYEKH